MIIAIDGPSGAGKSTLGKMLAEKLDLLYIDTGAMYRAVALAVLRTDEDSSNEKQTIKVASDSQIVLKGKPQNLQILLDDQDVTKEIRTPEVGQMASIVSTIPEVRQILVKHQRQLGNSVENCVLDGRDIGTVVFPNADIKFFLTAKPEARARRRFEEDIEKNIKVSYEETLEAINQRDERDVSRESSPLKIVEDAVVIDTSEMNIQEVFEKMIEKIQNLERNRKK